MPGDLLPLLNILQSIMPFSSCYRIQQYGVPFMFSVTGITKNFIFVQYTSILVLSVHRTNLVFAQILVNCYQ